MKLSDDNNMWRHLIPIHKLDSVSRISSDLWPSHITNLLLGEIMTTNLRIKVPFYLSRSLFLSQLIYVLRWSLFLFKNGSHMFFVGRNIDCMQSKIRSNFICQYHKRSNQSEKIYVRTISYDVILSELLLGASQWIKGKVKCTKNVCSHHRRKWNENKIKTQIWLYLCVLHSVWLVIIL